MAAQINNQLPGFQVLARVVSASTGALSEGSLESPGHEGTALAAKGVSGPATRPPRPPATAAEVVDPPMFSKRDAARASPHRLRPPKGRRDPRAGEQRDHSALLGATVEDGAGPVRGGGLGSG